VSIGTSLIVAYDEDDVRKVIESADQALYLAKNSGRNCVKSLVPD
jgi:PleD family two-component response regulator